MKKNNLILISVFSKMLFLAFVLISSVSCSGSKTDNKHQAENNAPAPVHYTQKASRKLVKAVEKNDLALVEKLLDAGESPNGTIKGYFRGGRKQGKKDVSNKDWTLLMYASFHNNQELAALLLSKKADVNAVNAAGHSALFLACAGRSEEMAAFLLEHQADVKQAGYDQNGMSALQWALAYEWSDISLKMIRLGADLNTSSSETGRTILLEALFSDSIRPEVIHLLIDSGADVHRLNSKYKSSPLMLACGRNDLISVQKILAKHVDVNLEDEQRSTALCYASRNDADDTKILELLVKHGAKVNMPGSYGRNALVEAVFSGSLKKVRFLLKNGAVINRKSDGFGGVSAISEAVSGDNLEMVKLVIDRGADISMTRDHGETVLLEAIRSEKSTEIVQLLIEKGADVNRSNDDKQTPLMKAAQYNLPEIIKLLLHAGATKEGKDVYGRTAMDLARETADRTGEDTVLNLLKD